MRCWRISSGVEMAAESSDADPNRIRAAGREVFIGGLETEIRVGRAKGFPPDG